MSGRALVTGASGGIGAAVRAELKRRGWSVVGLDLEAAGDEVIACDVTDDDAVRQAVTVAAQRLVGLDVVVNNAGIARDRMLVNLPAEDWDAVLAVHLRSTFLLTQRAARLWRDRSKAGEAVDGRVVNTVSSVGLYGHAGQANYAAAKAGIAGFTLGKRGPGPEQMLSSR